MTALWMDVLKYLGKLKGHSRKKKSLLFESSPLKIFQIFLLRSFILENMIEFFYNPILDLPVSESRLYVAFSLPRAGGVRDRTKSRHSLECLRHSLETQTLLCILPHPTFPWLLGLAVSCSYMCYRALCSVRRVIWLINIDQTIGLLLWSRLTSEREVKLGILHKLVFMCEPSTTCWLTGIN